MDSISKNLISINVQVTCHTKSYSIATYLSKSKKLMARSFSVTACFKVLKSESLFTWKWSWVCERQWLRKRNSGCVKIGGWWALMITLHTHHSNSRAIAHYRILTHSISSSPVEKNYSISTLQMRSLINIERDAHFS